MNNNHDDNVASLIAATVSLFIVGLGIMLYLASGDACSQPIDDTDLWIRDEYQRMERQREQREIQDRIDQAIYDEQIINRVQYTDDLEIIQRRDGSLETCVKYEGTETTLCQR